MAAGFTPAEEVLLMLNTHRSMAARLSPALAALLLTTACGGSGSADAGTPALCTLSTAAPNVETVGTRVLLQVRASQAASCITVADEPSQAYRDSGVPQKGLLAVFLPGTGGLPAQFPSFLQRGAARGYHVIGLTYTNPTSVNEICNSAAGNADCAGSVREEVLTGRDASPLVSITSNDAIESRLLALLKYLAFHRPADGWSQFVDGQGQLVWSKFSISGNSQGAGHAAYIGKVRAVHRVGLYAGPSDWVYSGNQPVNWYRLAALTPASSFYGYVHLPDTLANVSGNPTQVTNVWGDAGLLNMSGAVTAVTSSAAPWGGSHRLVTTACASLDAISQHNCPMLRGNEAVWDVVSFP
jgi:hypothetical protein